MSSARSRRVAVLLLAAFAAVVMVAPRALAASITVTDLTQPGFLIGKEARKAVFGFNMTDASGTATFDGLSVVLTDFGEDGDFNLTTLSDLRASPDGVAVYRDDAPADDSLGADDTRVSTGFTNTNGSVTVTVDSTIPDATQGAFTYFLAVQTSSTISDGDDFTVEIPSLGFLECAFETTPATGGLLGDPCPGGDTTQTITADAVVPTAQLTSAPTTSDGNVVWTFDKDVVGWSDENVVLREVGSSTNIASEVTYDAAARKATINPDGPLTPGTAYRTIVNPGSATELVTDEAGNPVDVTQADFTLADIGFTPGVVRGNTWFLNLGYDATHDVSFAFGRSTDFPVVGDWNDDGIFTGGVVRGNVWYLNDDFDSTHDATFAFGRSTDFPVVGDWDNDGVYTPGVVRGNVWFLNNDFDTTHDLTFAFGAATDYPVVGDWVGP